MARFVQLNNRFYSMELYSGKADLKPSHMCDFFLIVEHACDDEFIKEQALIFLMSQCKFFNFYGKQSKKWEIAFDSMHSQIYPQGNDTNVAMANAWNSFKDFVTALESDLSSRSIVPCNIYLVYDDEKIYKSVLQCIHSQL